MGGSQSGTAITPRERECLCRVVEGKTNRQIAAELLVSEATVKQTITRLCQKLGQPNRVCLAVAAVKAGLVRGPA